MRRYIRTHVSSPPSEVYDLAHCLDALVPQMSLSLMNGIGTLMDEIGGWQELSPINGTPLLHTGHGDVREQGDMVALLTQYCPRWQPDTGQPQSDRRRSHSAVT
ncbi:hypothetical protein [Salinactinospora qingdaonensis]|uniref:Uncharacterized protein n=1 Tax=Salinactinospora qingdaonensis TaxID=702744 RepID=A0ABP7FC13_9ACTN